jgi:hypothetical protein
VLWGIFALLFTAVVARHSGGQMQEPPLPLKVVVSTPKLRVTQNGLFMIEAKLVNVSDDRLSIFGHLLWGYAGGLTVHIIDQNGHPVAAQQHDDDMVSPSVLGNSDSYVLLFPSQFLGVERQDSVKNLFPKPGVYSLFVEYLSPIPNSYGKMSNFWGRERGSIRSAPIKIEVVPE